jgi:ABC-2 type transport system ATP-binding protein
VIELARLRKCFGPLVAVDDLELTIEVGTVFGFLGRNGAGKTTTIRMMMGLLEPTSGTVRLAGHDIARAPDAAKRMTGYLPDRPHLYDKLTGLEYLCFVGELFGLGRRDAKDRGLELLDEMRLTAQGGELVETFSHGMKQRLALAGALVHRPRILVLDEPMVGLDPEGARELKTRIAALAADGVTIFLSTHSLAVAEEVCGRIGIIDRGRLVALGSLDDLRARARSAAGAEGQGRTLEDVFLDILHAEAHA